MPITSRTCLEVRRDVHARLFQEELVVLDVRLGDYFSLDVVGAKVWGALADGQPAGLVAEVLAAEYDIDVQTVTTDVLTFAEELVRRGLMTVRIDELARSTHAR